MEHFLVYRPSISFPPLCMTGGLNRKLFRAGLSCRVLARRPVGRGGVRSEAFLLHTPPISGLGSVQRWIGGFIEDLKGVFCHWRSE